MANMVIIVITAELWPHFWASEKGHLRKEGSKGTICNSSLFISSPSSSIGNYTATFCYEFCKVELVFCKCLVICHYHCVFGQLTICYKMKNWNVGDRSGLLAIQLPVYVSIKIKEFLPFYHSINSAFRTKNNNLLQYSGLLYMLT